MVHLQVTLTALLTWLAEAQGNDEGDRGEQSPGKWDGGGGRGELSYFRLH